MVEGELQSPFVEQTNPLQNYNSKTETRDKEGLRRRKKEERKKGGDDNSKQETEVDGKNSEPKPIKMESFSLKKVVASFALVKPSFHIVWEANGFLFILYAILTLASGLFPAILAFLSKRVTDHVVDAISNSMSQGKTGEAESAMYSVVFYLLAELFTKGLEIVFSEVDVFTSTLMQTRTTAYVEKKVMKKMVELDLSYFEDPQFNDQLRQVEQNLNRSVSMVESILKMARTLITLFSMLSLLWNVSKELVLVALLTPIPAFVADSEFGLRGHRMNRKQIPSQRKMRYLYHVITGDQYAKEVKLFGLGDYIISQWEAILETFQGEKRALSFKRNSVKCFFRFVSEAVNSGVYYFIVYRAIVYRDVTIGDVSMYSRLTRNLSGRFRSLLQICSTIFEDSLKMETLLSLLALKPRLFQPEKYITFPSSVPVHAPAPAPATASASETTIAVPFPNVQPLQIEFQNVSFQYPGRDDPVLSDINFTIHPGEVVALVGENGAGKSTLVKLATRLCDPSSGNILVNGENVKYLSPDDFYSHISVVFQDFGKYSMSVGDNIGLGDVENIKDAQKITAAADWSGASSCVSKLPKSFETLVGGWFDGSTQLSGGEWQKVALARSFMHAKEAGMIVMDEPTSALDARAEYEVFKRLRELIGGRSAIFISHRLSSVRMADRILVLQDGKLIEHGNHDQLMELGGRYKELFLLQADAYK